MTGPPCPAPVSSLVPAPPVYQVSSAVQQQKYRKLKLFFLVNCDSFMSTESQSNHSSQSDSGVSETTSSGHVRSQSVVSSIFSEAWKRGNQADEPKVTIEELH